MKKYSHSYPSRTCREDMRKGCRRVNMVEYYTLMDENGKMRPVETVLRMGEGRQRRMMEGVNLTKIDYKHFVNVIMYPQYNINMIIFNK
jgi:hypothetical protein